ncbi:MAG: tRNA glutamyl-Q(34) synthetase GluQRS [Myxococcota bacterium]
MRGRFAPSPTGRMHLGNARTALLGWLQARAAGGQFLLRIEDLDRARSRPELVDELFRDLEFLGLTWDEAPLFQSQREEAYRAALEQLSREGRTYPCFCSRAEVARAASAPHGPADEGPRYPGTCARRPETETAARLKERPATLRFRVQPGVERFVDLVHGEQSQDVEATVGDFVVRRADGVASYQLAVVVDDADSSITDVLRADDLLSSTARQLQLYRALKRSPPRFAHVPLLLGEDHQRLAKREGAFAVADLRQAGVSAERIIGLLARWSGLGDGSPVRAAELVEGFSLSRIPRQPVVAAEAELNERLLPFWRGG